ncbi:hypothetical protein D9M72_517580 [compost metagenome]
MPRKIRHQAFERLAVVETVDVLKIGAQPWLGVGRIWQAGGAQQEVVPEVLRNQCFKGRVDRAVALSDGAEDRFTPCRQPRNRCGLVNDEVGVGRVGAEIVHAFLAVDGRGFVIDVVFVDEARMPDVAGAEECPPEQREERVGLQLGAMAEEAAPFVAAAFRHPGQGGAGQINGV